MCASSTAPALLRLTVPRLEGHSFQDTQTYKSEAEVEAEWARDPLPKLKAHVVALAARRERMGPTSSAKRHGRSRPRVAERRGARRVADPET